VFVKIDNATAGLIAKTIQPLIGPTADHNFVESLRFVQRLNETTSKNGPGVQRLGKKLNIDPQIRQQFNEVVDVVFQRAINMSAPAEPRTPAREISLNTGYFVPVQRSSNQPQPGLSQPGAPQTRTQSGYQSPGYQSPGYQPPVYRPPVHHPPNDLGQSRPGYPGRNSLSVRNGVQGGYGNAAQMRLPYRIPVRQSSQRMVNGYPMPARAYQAPGNAPRVIGNPYPAQYGQPVQASYNYGRQAPSHVQHAGGWRQR
jgi:hypothetical protein